LLLYAVNLPEPQLSLQPGLFYLLDVQRQRRVAMTAFDLKLGVVVSGNEIVVVLPESIYTVTYFKRAYLRKTLRTKMTNAFQ
jgi:hypothetical protein